MAELPPLLLMACYSAVLQKAETEMLAKKRRAENPTYTDLYGQRMTTRLEEGRAEDGDD